MNWKITKIRPDNPNPSSAVNTLMTDRRPRPAEAPSLPGWIRLASAVIALASGAALVLTVPFIISRMSVHSQRIAASEQVPPITASDLAAYNGTDPSKPIYLALDGYVYDVTAGADYYKTGGTYHFLAGRDASAELHIAGAAIIRRKYPIVAKFVK